MIGIIAELIISRLLLLSLLRTWGSGILNLSRNRIIQLFAGISMAIRCIIYHVTSKNLSTTAGAESTDFIPGTTAGIMVGFKVGVVWRTYFRVCRILAIEKLGIKKATLVLQLFWSLSPVFLQCFRQSFQMAIIFAMTAAFGYILLMLCRNKITTPIGLHLDGTFSISSCFPMGRWGIRSW